MTLNFTYAAVDLREHEQETKGNVVVPKIPAEC